MTPRVRKVPGKWTAGNHRFPILPTAKDRGFHCVSLDKKNFLLFLNFLLAK